MDRAIGNPAGTQSDNVPQRITVARLANYVFFYRFTDDFGHGFVLCTSDTLDFLMSLPSVIAIDGPAASGKSTVGKLVADRLGYLYIDTGAMYRAITWIALARGVDIDDELAVTRLAETVQIDICPASIDDGRQYTVLADGQDITWDLRRPEVDRYVSPVSAYPGVRAALTEQQRRIARAGRVIMVGRDIGTVVVPDADLKIYLDAAVEERARRRYRERLQHGEPAHYEEILAAMQRRDQIDSQRTCAPLRPAGDAVVIDSTNLDINAVVERVLALVSRTK